MTIGLLKETWETSKVACHTRTVIFGPLEDEGHAGDPVPNAGKRQHLEFVQHVLPKARQEHGLRVVPSHHVAPGLRVQIFGPEQNLKHQAPSMVVMRMQYARKGPQGTHGLTSMRQGPAACVSSLCTAVKADGPDF